MAIKPLPIEYELVVNGLRICSACTTFKELSSFRPKKDRKDRLSSQCKECEKVTWLKYYNNNKKVMIAKKAVWSKKNPDKVISYGVKVRHGITSDDITAILSTQNGVCAACGSSEYGWSGAWNVDHDHRCCPQNRSCEKCRRGLLCSSCNMILGYCKDNPDQLEKLIEYLRKWTNG